MSTWGPIPAGVEATFSFSGTFDAVTEPTRTYTRRSPVVLRLRPGKVFRAVATVTMEHTGAEVVGSVTYSPADRRRLAKYLHPDVYARRSAMHSVLATGSIYVYDMWERIGGSAGGIYLSLDRLEKSGWVLADWAEQPDGTRRRTYRLDDRRALSYLQRVYGPPR